VGGTTLNVNGSDQRTTETGWSGSGGGCSAIEVAPTYQSLYGVTLCGPARAMPDIAAVADPSTGVWITDTWDFPSDAGICCIGGTSLASPVMAGIFADVDTARVGFGKAKFGGSSAGIFLDLDLYHAFNANSAYFFFDVTSGCNVEGCAAPGYDLVTGIGVLRGPDTANRFFGFP
jgi:subtilase family serine protease